MMESSEALAVSETTALECPAVTSNGQDTRPLDIEIEADMLHQQALEAAGELSPHGNIAMAMAMPR